MYYHFNIEEQIQSIMNKCKLSDFEKPITPNVELCDITDGELYKSVLASVDGHLFKKKQAFSFSMNTDGVSLSKSSKLSMWPVFLTINEVPLFKRYSIDHVILAGLTVGEEKPNMDLFFNPIVIQLKKLELGVNISIENVLRETKFFCICCCCDKPAKASLLNMQMYNSFYGCTKCLQKAESFKMSQLLVEDLNGKTKPSNSNKRDGTTRLYTYNQDWKIKRTPENYELDLKQTIINIADKVKDPEVHGVKGPCILSSLKYFHPIRSHCIDYMHSVLEGVIKNFFKYWFDSAYSNTAFSLRKYMKEINNRLSKIKPPRFIPSTPRSIDSYNFWSAHEYLSFFMYYLLSVFENLMSHDHYENIKKLIVFLETILAQKINIERLKLVENVLIEFVSELESLYTKSIMLSGVHELLHLTDCTIEFGPLNSTNCFPHEENNRKILRITHGNDLIGEEIIKVYLGMQVLSTYLNNTSNQKLKKYIEARSLFKTSNKKRNQDLNTNFIKLKNLKTSTNCHYIEVFSHYIQKTVSDLSICENLTFNDIPYSSIQNKTKRSDSCFISKKLE